jgi:aldose 1-epimerase
MEGVLKGGKSTPIALTNHSYFNLAGHDSKEGITNQIIEIDADYFTPTNEDCIPTRKLQHLEDEGPEAMNLKNGSKFSDIIRQ